MATLTLTGRLALALELALLGILLNGSCLATVVRLPLFSTAVSSKTLRCSNWQVSTYKLTEHKPGTPPYEQQSPATYHWP